MGGKEKRNREEWEEVGGGGGQSMLNGSLACCPGCLDLT